MTSRLPAPPIDRPDWVPDTVFYQIFPDRFRNDDPSNDPPDTVPWGSEPDRHHFQGGDLAGVIEGLGHLERLGVSGLYLNPIFTAGTNHRYDTWDYFTVDPHLGDVGVLRELVAEAHHRGIRVILDGVFNHCGDGHPAFRDWQTNGAASEYAGWFTTFPSQPLGAPDYQTCGGAAYLPKLDLTNPAARDHVLRAATYWIEAAAIDGWRLDVPFKVAHEFWAAFRETVRSVAPDAYLLGEVWRDAKPWLDVFDGVTNYRQRDNIVGYCIHDALDGEDFAQETADLAGHHSDAALWMVSLVGSHDTARLRTLAGRDVDRAVCAIAAMFTVPGVPLIYYGDEVGLDGDNDPGCRRAMPWDDSVWDQRLLATVTQLCAVRAASPALRRGDFQPLTARNGLVAFERTHGDDRVAVVLNPRGPQRQVDLLIGGDKWSDAVTSQQHAATNGAVTIDDVPGCSFLILREEPQA
jgi:cyclomaltodextrinase